MQVVRVTSVALAFMYMYLASTLPSARAEWITGLVDENCNAVCAAMTPAALCDVT